MQLTMRIIPATIVAAMLTLGIRLGDMWQQSGTAQAQQPPAAAAKPPAGAPGPAEAPPAAPQKAVAQFEDQGGFSPSELEVLQSLMTRREALDERAAELDRREALLKAAEGRIDTKVQELKQLQATLETAMRKYDDEEDGRKKSLVKMFETMKPKDAARIFEQMELAVLVDLVERMREAKAAPVLAEMTPTRAKQVAGEIAKRRQPLAGG